ncbi:MAG: hypothetical protein HY746_02065 [Elusimicrobia bacterium]|nr:hypothetical protein [Elusimicrobiota bacterium]
MNFSLLIIFFFFLPDCRAAVTQSEVGISTSLPLSPAPQTILPSKYIPPELILPWWKKPDYEASAVFFADTMNTFPSLFLSASNNKSGFALIYSYAKLPEIDMEYDFLRNNGINIKRVLTQVKIGASTATYTTDLIDRFRVETHFFYFLYSRMLFSKEHFRTFLLGGIPVVLHKYEVKAALEDSSVFSESESLWGAGISNALVVSFGSGYNKNLCASLIVLHNKLWFESSSKKLAGSLAKELDGWRFGFSAGWRFNFYE